MGHVALWAQPWVVVNSLQLRLSLILLVFEREVVDWVVSWLVTPVGAQVLRLLLLVSLVTTEIMVSVGHTPAEEVPVRATVERGHADAAPEDPTHLTDHPDISLSHIVRDVKHHILLLSKI